MTLGGSQPGVRGREVGVPGTVCLVPGVPGTVHLFHKPAFGGTRREKEEKKEENGPGSIKFRFTCRI